MEVKKNADESSNEKDKMEKEILFMTKFVVW